ncbi:MAG: response regulator transcription factor [Bacteroidales bacterium]|nr:response regulator transcription factor [Bacteroidales bacterium]
MKGKTSILLVDDHPLFIFGVKSMLCDIEDFEVVGTAGDGPTAIQMAKELKPDIMLLDIMLPGMSGIEVARNICTTLPEVNIIILSSDTSADTLEELLKMSIKGIVSKLSDDSCIVKAIRCVNEGQLFYGTDIESLIERIKYDKEEDGVTFSAREMDIIRLSCEGLQYKEIAQKLGISDNTVASIKKNIFHKLDINNSVELVLYAIKKNLISI